MREDGRSSSFGDSYARWVIRWRWPVIGATTALFLACASGATRLVFDDNYRAFIADDNPHLEALNALEDTYAREEIILFVLAPEDGDVFTREVLTAVEELTLAAWQIESCARVDSITSFQHTRAVEDDIEIASLVEDASALTPGSLADLRAIVLNEVLLVNRLISPEGHVTAVAATLVLPGVATGERDAPVGHARELAAEIEAAHPGLRVIVTGGAVLSLAFTEHTLADTATLTPLMYLIIFALIALSFRSPGPIAGAIAVILMSVGSAMGLAGWLGIHLTMPTAAMPTIVMTLAVADSIHLLSVYMGALREGASKRDALAQSLEVNLGPVFITSLTTCAGLATMNFSGVPPLEEFGNVTALGVAMAFLYSVTFLPALIAVLPAKAKTGSMRQGTLMPRLGEFVIARQTMLLWGFAVAALILAAFVPRNEFRNNWVKWFSERTQFQQDLSFVSENLSGINAIEFSIPAEGSGGVNSPEYLGALDAFAVWLRTQEHVRQVGTLADIMKRLNMNMHGDDRAFYRIPDSQELAAQYLLIYEMSLPYGMDLNNQINIDKSATRLTVITDDVDSTVMREMAAAAEEWLREEAPPYMATEGTGNGVMFASIAEGTIRSMIVTVPLALLAVSIALIFAFRSLKYGLLSLIPNLVPIAMAFGVWGIFIGRINFGVACVAALSLGIVVDDTVHFLSKYLWARRNKGCNSEDAVRYAFDTVGRALGMTSAVLVAGFLVLTLSDFQFNAHMGLLAAIAVAFALASDLLFLPPILLRVDRDRPAPAAEENRAN